MDFENYTPDAGRPVFAILVAGVLALVGCGPEDLPESPGDGHGHAHVAPHGGTPVALGDELFHLELLLDSEAGRLSVYVLDGHMEEFIRINVTSFQLDVRFGETSRSLQLEAVASTATGETTGDTSHFAAQAEWLRNTPRFTGFIPAIKIRNHLFREVEFSFPEGNEETQEQHSK